jgi:hypothetical protein
LIPSEIITQHELDEVQRRGICPDDTFTGRWRINELGQQLWIPQHCALALESWDPEKNSGLFAQCLRERRYHKIGFAGDSVMRRAALFMVNRKKDEQFAFAHGIQKDLWVGEGLRYVFVMLRTLLSENSGPKTRAALEGMINDDSFDVVIFNIGMWDLREGRTAEDYVQTLESIATLVVAKQREVPRRVFVWKTTSSPEARQRLDEEGSSWGLSGSKLDRGALLIAMNRGATELMRRSGVLVWDDDQLIDPVYTSYDHPAHYTWGEATMREAVRALHHVLCGAPATAGRHTP